MLKQDFDLLLGSQYQILCLRRRLVEAATAIDDQNKRCKILEQRLTREQLQVTRANGHITRLVRQQPAVSALRLCAHRREIYLQMVRRGLFSYMFLWRLSRILGRKSSRYFCDCKFFAKRNFVSARGVSESTFWITLAKTLYLSILANGSRFRRMTSRSFPNSS